MECNTLPRIILLLLIITNNNVTIFCVSRLFSARGEGSIFFLMRFHISKKHSCSHQYFISNIFCFHLSSFTHALSGEPLPLFFSCFLYPVGSKVYSTATSGAISGKDIGANKVVFKNDNIQVPLI